MKIQTLFDMVLKLIKLPIDFFQHGEAEVFPPKLCTCLANTTFLT
jgi:hypothetical protein